MSLLLLFAGAVVVTGGAPPQAQAVDAVPKAAAVAPAPSANATNPKPAR